MVEINKADLKFIKAPSVILRLRDLTPNEKLMLQMMYYWADANNKIENKSQGLLSDVLGMSTVTVSKSVKGLVEKGYIKRERRYRELDSYEIIPNRLSIDLKSSDFFNTEKSIVLKGAKAEKNEIKITDTEEKKEENMGQYVGTVNEIQARNENREQWGERVKTAFQEKAVVAVAAAEVPKAPEYIIREMEKCIPKMKLNSMMMQMSKSLSDEKNLQRLEECLSPYIEGFSKVEREYLYKKLLYHFKNKSEQAA